MKNSERQKKLDEEKYFKGIEMGKDPSGTMPYCYTCENQTQINRACKICHEERVKNDSCAKAYNKLNRRK